MASRLAMMQRLLAGESLEPGALPFTFPPPLSRLLGIELTEIAEARCVMRLRTDPAQHANPMGTIPGGVLCDLADAAIGTAHAGTLQDGESFTSIDLKINFLRPVWQDTLLAAAQAVHRGRNVSYYECTVHNAAGKLVAKVTSSVMTLRGPAAEGR